MALDLLTVLVLGFFAVRLARGARIALSPGGRQHVLFVVRSLRPRHFLRAPVVFSLVVVAVLFLTAVPGLDFGWWTAIGGTGNPVTGSTDRTAGTALEWVIPLVFGVLLLPALPLLAEAEERVFRRGSEHRSFMGKLGWGVLFGLAHALVGIPIGAALALSIGGWYFTWAYMRAYRRGGPAEALLESTCSHLAYNLEIVAIIVVVIATGSA